MMSSHQITEDTLYKLSGSHLPELDVNQRCAAPPLFHPLSAAHLRDYVIHERILLDSHKKGILANVTIPLIIKPGFHRMKPLVL